MLPERPHDLMREREALAHARRGRLARHIGAAQQHVAAIGAQDAGDDAQQRGLAGAVRADQTDELAGLDA